MEKRDKRMGDDGEIFMGIKGACMWAVNKK
jgi:hypothetical protein